MLSDATILRNVPVPQLDATDPDFRRIPNLFEIVSFDYWHANYGLDADDALIDAYLLDMLPAISMSSKWWRPRLNRGSKERSSHSQPAVFSPAAMM